MESPVLPDGSTSSVAETETSAFTIVCAWCGAIKTQGNETISHGICAECSLELMRKDEIA